MSGRKSGGKDKDKGDVAPDPTDDGSPPATAVDFIFRTMLARAGAPGKRQIRPKNVEELLQADIQELGSDEDPDFDVSKDKHHNESDVSIDSASEDDGANKSDDDDDKGSMDGNVEDSDDEDDESYDAEKDPRRLDSSDGDSGDDEDDDDSNSSGESSEEDTDSQSPIQKRSALRETLQKLNDAELAPQRNKKRKRPRKAGTLKKIVAPAKGAKSGNKKDEAASSTTAKAKAKRPRANAKSKDAKKPSARGGVRKKAEILAKSRRKDKDKGKKKKKSSDRRSITDMVVSMEHAHQEQRKEIAVGSPICSACLGKSSDGMNEIVECDSCGITVHEGCYGVSDTLSVSSGTGSSCSTEPWFCDACRTGAKHISCELCPMEGGLYKETTAGRWVHLVCALYTPGVVITDSGLPSLFEIPYAKWGAHACSLCEDVKFNRSGICIPCDAGMCKTYLHATCAQRHGLLSDPILQVSDMEADPFFAACKLHTNRDTSKRRAKFFAILQEQLRIKRQQKLAPNITVDERNNQNRIKRKLERIRFKVAIKQAHSYSNTSTMAAASSSSTTLTLTTSNVNDLSSSLLPPLTSTVDTIPPSWSVGTKKARLLPTSAGTALAFHRKASLMGLDIKALELEDKHSRIVASVKKKWNVPPGLSVEYGAYYADRENRITNLNGQCEKLGKENRQLNNKQVDLLIEYDKQYVHNDLMEEDTDTLRQKLVGMTSILRTLCPPTNKKLLSSIQGIESKTEVPVGQRNRSPSHSNRRLSPPKSGGSKSAKKSPTRSPNIKSPPERLAIKVCSVCDESDAQPWIIRCDNCKKLYHLKCLDPPLTRLPKRTPQCGWMCSDCGEEEYDADEPDVDTEAPRTLRGRTKIRKPGKYRHSTDSREGGLKIICDGTSKPESTELPSQIPVKVETPMSSPAILTNGTIKSKTPKKRKRTSSSATTTPSLLSPDSLLTQQALSDSKMNGPTPKKPRKSSKKAAQTLTPSTETTPEFDNIGGSSVDRKVEKKPKKPRVRKPKEDKTENQDASSAQETVTQEVEAQGQGTSAKRRPTKVPKIKRGSTTPALSTEGATPTDVPKKKRPYKRKILVPQIKSEILPGEGDSAPTDGTLILVPGLKTNKKLKRTKAQGDGTPRTVVRKMKRPRKSPAEIAKMKKDVENKIIGSMMAAAAAAEVTKTEDGVVTNGIKAKKVYRRKSFAASATGGTPMPPKKRKRVVSSAIKKDNSHQDAVIDAVATGCVSLEDNQKNGISLPQLPDGVLMQGVAPLKTGWNNDPAVEEDHSIMKGHAMGTNCSGGEVVTVNTSDLIDCIINPPSSSAPTTTVSISSYSPGFYSNSTPSTTTENNVSATKFVTSSDSMTTTTTTDQTKSSIASVPLWGQGQAQTPQPAQESQNQNVIKLIYENPEVAPAAITNANRPPVTLAPYPPPVVSPPSVSAFSSASSSPSNSNSEFGGKCFACNKDEVKKNMVTCDKCAQDFHFMCLTPPLKYSPRRRNYAWYCSSCDDTENQQKHSEAVPLSSSAELEPERAQNSAPPLQKQSSSSSSVTVHLFSDGMKNLMKNLKP